jgi:hypothetical protein
MNICDIRQNPHMAHDLAMIGIDETEKKIRVKSAQMPKEPIGKTKELSIRIELIHYEETGDFTLLMLADTFVEITHLLETILMQMYSQHMV